MYFALYDHWYLDEFLFNFCADCIDTQHISMNDLVLYRTQDLLPPELELRPVPPNLIPTESKSINYEWAEKTFRYACLFGQNFVTSNSEDNQNVQAWIDLALQLQTELRELGVEKAHEKIISIFCEHNVCMPGSTKTY